MPHSLIWVSRTLTDITGCTQRRFRYVRWYHAALKGWCTVFPALRGDLLVDIARLCTLVERRLGDSDDDDPDDVERRFRQHMRNLRAMRSFTEPWQWVGDAA